MRTPASTLAPGFARPAWDSQAIFRGVLAAMAHPGHVADLPIALEAPAPFAPATAAVCLALLDFETAAWIQPVPGASDAEAYLRFHCGCRLVSEPACADFAVIFDPGQAPPLDGFACGQPERPHLGSTLIVQVDSLDAGPEVTLRGPGIADREPFRAAGLPPAFWEQWRRNTARFPLGVDVLLTAGSRLAALPRTVRPEG